MRGERCQHESIEARRPSLSLPVFLRLQTRMSSTVAVPRRHVLYSKEDQDRTHEPALRQNKQEQLPDAQCAYLYNPYPVKTSLGHSLEQW